MRHFISKFIADESGGTAIEYGLIAGFISMAIVLAVTSVGASLFNKFNFIATVLQ